MTISIRGNPTWVEPAGRSSDALRLFCFPCAGGSASAFHAWVKPLAGTARVCRVELPGRGKRFSEPAIECLPSLVEALRIELALMRGQPFAFFGHSMGALVAFELARELWRCDGVVPDALFVAGSPAPQLLPREESIRHLPPGELLDTLRGYEGSPVELFQHESLVELLLPTIRADFTLCETYVYRRLPPLECPIVALCGIDDKHAPVADIEAWREQTRGRFVLHRFVGSHFFVKSAEPHVLDVMTAELSLLAPV
jgi:medium-chain acyl-[acyl-carrier-protein] hydrolase